MAEEAVCRELLSAMDSLITRENTGKERDFGDIVAALERKRRSRSTSNQNGDPVVKVADGGEVLHLASPIYQNSGGKTDLATQVIVVVRASPREAVDGEFLESKFIKDSVER